MNFLASGAFWGILLIIFGLSIIINKVLHIHIPVFRIMMALIFVYIGFKILLGGFGKSGNDTVFSESTVHAEGEHNEYNIIFGKANIDLSHADLTTKKGEINMIFGGGDIDARNINIKDKNAVIEVSAIFGGGNLQISENTPLKIKVESAFGGAKLPDGNTTAFGTYIYKTPSFDPDKPHLYIKANVVFGGLEIIK
jgi:predicted membrane protein